MEILGEVITRVEDGEREIATERRAFKRPRLECGRGGVGGGWVGY
jgi:hypothetical protein